MASCAFGLEANAFANEESSFVENTRKIFEISILQAMRLAATFFLPIISKLMKLSYVLYFLLSFEIDINSFMIPQIPA